MVAYGINADNCIHIIADNNELLPLEEEYYRSWRKESVILIIKRHYLQFQRETLEAKRQRKYIPSLDI